MKKVMLGGMALIAVTLWGLLLPDFAAADPVPPECFRIELWEFEDGEYPETPSFEDSLEVVHPRDRISVRCNIRVESVEQELSTELLHINPAEERIGNNEEGEWRFWIINEKNGENTLVDESRTVLALGEYDVQVKGVIKDTIQETPGVRKDLRVPLIILNLKGNPGPGITFPTEIVSRERERIENEINGSATTLTGDEDVQQSIALIVQPLIEAVQERLNQDEPRNAESLFTLSKLVSQRSSAEFQALLDQHDEEVASLIEDYEAELASAERTRSTDLAKLRADHSAELQRIREEHDTQRTQMLETQQAEIAVRDRRIIDLQAQSESNPLVPVIITLETIALVGIAIVGIIVYMTRRRSG